MSFGPALTLPYRVRPEARHASQGCVRGFYLNTHVFFSSVPVVLKKEYDVFQVQQFHSLHPPKLHVTMSINPFICKLAVSIKIT